MRYLLSKLIPVPMRSRYIAYEDSCVAIVATWWQWRGRIWRHRAIAA